MRGVFAFLLLMLAFVPAPRAGDVDPGQPFVVGVGETVVVGDLPLLLTLEDVPSDSRCPRNVVCVWEGEATLEVTLEVPPGEAVTVDLHSPGSPMGPSEFEIAQLVVKVIDVAPYPADPVPIDSGEYRITFVVDSLAEDLPVRPSNWSTLKGAYR